MIDQIVKQLNKLIPVLRVNEHKNVIEKDTVLMKFQLTIIYLILMLLQEHIMEQFKM